MKKLFFRYFWFIIGIITNSFGIAFITKANLGTSPISSVPYVLSFRFPLSFGVLTFLLNALFIVGEILLLRKNFQRHQYLQILVNVIFSAFVDISMIILTNFVPVHFFSQFISLIIGCAILALGICIEVAPNVLMVPAEGLVKAIALTRGKKFGTVKIIFDTTIIVTAGCLSLLFFHKFQGLGIGTIISAYMVGKFVNIYHKHLHILKKIPTDV